MQYLHVMESLQAPHYLYHNVPDLLFLYVGASLLVGADFLEDVAVVCEFHDDAEGGGWFVDEGLFVGYDIDIVDGGENSDFVKSIFFFSI